jgi:hypothetical protein
LDRVVPGVLSPKEIYHKLLASGERGAVQVKVSPLVLSEDPDERAWGAVGFLSLAGNAL